LEAALKTQYKKDVEASSGCPMLKSSRCIPTSVVLSCQMVVKDNKRDSQGQLLQWKGRLANGGHHSKASSKKSSIKSFVKALGDHDDDSSNLINCNADYLGSGPDDAVQGRCVEACAIKENQA